MRILFVCTGNICRSPTAEGVARRVFSREGLTGVVLDSAGTTAFHVGDAPDERARAAARKRGYELTGIRARQVRPEDFEDFDLVLAMDHGHYSQLRRLCPRGAEDRLRLFSDFAAGWQGQEVPDPYYGGRGGFETVLDMIEAGVAGLAEEARRRSA